MKRFLCTSLVGLCLLGFGSLRIEAQTRIALIDLEKVFDNYWKTKKADANIKEQAGTFLKERKKMTDDYEKAKQEYKKLLDSANDQIVSSEERDKRKKAAEGKLIEMQELETSVGQFDRTSQSSIDEQKRRMRDNILKEIREEVNRKAKSGNFNLVLDSSGLTWNRTPVVLYTYGMTDTDLTEAVLTTLNMSMPAGFLKSLESKEEKTDGKK